MQDPFKGFNDDDDDQNNQNGDGPQGLPLPPNYATVVNPETGNMRIAKVGFSWTMFFFQPLPSIFRSDWYNFLCIVGIEIGSYMFLSMITTASQFAIIINSFFALFFGIVWGSLYNMMYFKHLFNRGFKPADERSRDLLARAHYWSRPKE